MFQKLSFTIFLLLETKESKTSDPNIRNIKSDCIDRLELVANAVLSITAKCN